MALQFKNLRQFFDIIGQKGTELPILKRLRTGVYEVIFKKTSVPFGFFIILTGNSIINHPGMILVKIQRKLLKLGLI